MLARGEYEFLKLTEREEDQEKDKEKEEELSDKEKIDAAKYSLLVGILTQAFQAEHEKYLKSRGKDKRHVSFEMELNSERNNPGYHFPRMLGLMLQEVQNDFEVKFSSERILPLSKIGKMESITPHYRAWEKQPGKMQLLNERKKEMNELLSYCPNADLLTCHRLLQDPSHFDDFNFVKQLLRINGKIAQKKIFSWCVN